MKPHDLEETARLLLDACAAAGVDAEEIFRHFDEADIRAYGEVIGQPDGIALDDLWRWMASTAVTIRADRCLCGTCKVRRAVALVAADPGLKLCPSCRGAGTSCGTCCGRGAVAA